ncbi:TylF/MycF/NovP-related O-methyltransferase [Anabaena sp. CS-542/02]|uniref:TylF/MycF/NovP-related O-methyltransferase n=1 Tax=Anabaena sp. CS-542/02 TaxID=3021719 RepID=UPI00232FC6B1|nr:TylF/MycF/NovP-related O-methyltransferase [Anabaena sp. CS-542/02]MDB9445575.1 macrocin O-methyltransferase [Anabaena sp. CS-542/02]
MKSLIKFLFSICGFDIVRKKSKNTNFINDRNFPPDFDNLSKTIIDYVSPYTMTGIERINSLVNATKYVIENNIEGDFVECGVWKGGSMMAIAYTLNHFSCNSRNLYLFDTFEGMSIPTSNDVDLSGLDAQTLLNKSDKLTSPIWCYSTLDEVKNNMIKTGYSPEKKHFIKGKVEDSIPLHAPNKIALLRLDTDWYESTKHELVYLFPRLVNGGVIIIDDYGHWQGCRQAVDDYIRENNIPILLNRIDYTGRIAIKVQIN